MLGAYMLKSTLSEEKSRQKMMNFFTDDYFY